MFGIHSLYLIQFSGLKGFSFYYQTFSLPICSGAPINVFITFFFFSKRFKSSVLLKKKKCSSKLNLKQFQFTKWSPFNFQEVFNKKKKNKHISIVHHIYFYFSLNQKTLFAYATRQENIEEGVSKNKSTYKLC